MANPSKRYPWIVEIRLTGKWWGMGAYRDRDEAEMQLKLAKKRQPDQQFRLAEFGVTASPNEPERV
jgi:hypothetical protein